MSHAQTSTQAGKYIYMTIIGTLHAGSNKPLPESTDVHYKPTVTTINQIANLTALPTHHSQTGNLSLGG